MINNHNNGLAEKKDVRQNVLIIYRSAWHCSFVLALAGMDMVISTKHTHTETNLGLCA